MSLFPDLVHEILWLIMFAQLQVGVWLLMGELVAFAVSQTEAFRVKQKRKQTAITDDCIWMVPQSLHQPGVVCTEAFVML